MQLPRSGFQPLDQIWLALTQALTGITIAYARAGARPMRPMWTMEEMGIDHKLVTMRFPARDRHKEFTAINPLGTVP